MKQQNFQQKRIVQLSRELDSERQKYARLAKESSQLSSKIKESLQEIQEYKEKIIQYQINNHQIQQKLREVQRENLLLQDEIDAEKKARSEAEVENVRQRQKLEELKSQMVEYENKAKSLLYERTGAISDKDKQIYRLKQQNLQIEKLYMNERERIQRKEEKQMRQLASLYKQFEAFRKDISSFKNQTEKSMQNERTKFKAQASGLIKRIEQLQAKLKKEQQLSSQIADLKSKLQQVIVQNSEKIIQLYKYRYA